jgi:hypothetical protein
MTSVLAPAIFRVGRPARRVYSARQLGAFVTWARRVWRECAAIDPDDASGRVARLHEVYHRLFWAASVGVSRVDPGSRRAGPGPKMGTGGQDPRYRHYPAVFPEVTLTSREAAAILLDHYEYVDEHLIDARRTFLDYLATVIPRVPGEAIPAYRARLARRRELWREGVSEAVTMGRQPLTSLEPAVRPRPGRARSPGIPGTRTERTGRTPGASPPGQSGPARPRRRRSPGA